MPSIWSRRQGQQHKRHKRSAASISTLNTMMAGSTGLFDEFGTAIGVLVDCFLEVQVVGLRSCINVRILFRNNSGQDVRNGIFRASTVDGAFVASAECYVDVDETRVEQVPGLEHRDITKLSHQGSILECQIGSLGANRDCVVFVRYQYDLAFDGDAALIRFPLPGRRGEKLIARQKSQPGLWNASQLFSFIAIDIQISDFPGEITHVSSDSHAISSSTEDSKISIELDEYSFKGQDEVVLRISSDPLEDEKLPSNGLEIKIEDLSRQSFNYLELPSAMFVKDVMASDMTSSTNQLFRPHDPSFGIFKQQKSGTSELAVFEERRPSSIKSLCLPPPDITVEQLYSDIWQVNEARMSYSSAEESTESDRNSRIRRRKTTVHRKCLSLTSSELSNLSEISWLDDASDDEVNDEADKIFEEFSISQKRSEKSDSIAVLDEFDVEECKSIRIVRHNRPKIVTISPKIPQMSLGDITPPESPVRTDSRSSNRLSMDLLRELDSVLENLNHLLEDSPTPYLILNQEFAATLGLQLAPLKTHIGAQALTLPNTPFWIREGIWANAISLQFLKCVIESPFFKTLHEDARVEYKLLYSIIESSFSSHGLHLPPVARMTRLSNEELLELAAEVIQDLIDGEDQTNIVDLEGRQVDKDQYIIRPISPPKTPDDDDRNNVNVEAFVDCFQC